KDTAAKPGAAAKKNMKQPKPLGAPNSDPHPLAQTSSQEQRQVMKQLLALMNPTGHSVITHSVAFGAPGIEPRWTSSAKEGVGTAYHTSCRVWFTLSHGIVNEIYYPHIDQPN